MRGSEPALLGTRVRGGDGERRPGKPGGGAGRGISSGGQAMKRGVNSCTGSSLGGLEREL